MLIRTRRRPQPQRVAGEQLGTNGGGELGRPPARRARADDWRQGGELRHIGLEQRRHGRAEDDELGLELGRRVRERVERGVRPEEGDAGAARAEEQAEDDQRQVVELAGRAGEQHARAASLIPPAGQPEQSAPDDVAGEVLLADRRLARLPPLAESVQVRQHDLAEQRFDGVDGEQAVELALCSTLVEPVEGRAERAVASGSSGGPAEAASAGAATASRAASAADRPAARFACMRRTRSSSAAE